jgi:diadenosine tetraphosphate (Ap4A) HIT family hydrolase
MKMQDKRFHHIHIIPRYKGDVENPRGGIRGVIPSKKKSIDYFLKLK